MPDVDLPVREPAALSLDYAVRDRYPALSFPDQDTYPPAEAVIDPVETPVIEEPIIQPFHQHQWMERTT